MKRGYLANAGLALTLVACRMEPEAPAETANSTRPDTASDAAALRLVASKRIFFGHQSVGANILDGVRELAKETPGAGLVVVNSLAPDTVGEPALMEASLGENGNPGSKTNAFAAVVDRGFGRAGGIALVKYCYLDMRPDSDPVRLFDDYRARMKQLSDKYPALTLVHVTMPLTVVESGPKRLVKRLLGKTTAVDLNAKRNAYNERLRMAYAGQAPVFDLARLESIGRTGRRTTVGHRDGTVPSLAPEWSDDGGHLNAAGRRMVAREFVAFLAKL